jgi:hypothetical protein
MGVRGTAQKRMKRDEKTLDDADDVIHGNWPRASDQYPSSATQGRKRGHDYRVVSSSSSQAISKLSLNPFTVGRRWKISVRMGKNHGGINGLKYFCAC